MKYSYYLSRVESGGGGGSALGNLKTEGDVVGTLSNPPSSFEEADNLPIPSEASTVLVGLTRSSPKTTDALSQSLRLSMAGYLYEGRSGEGSVYEYPTRYASLLVSRKKPLECKGLLACFRMLKTNPHLKGKNVVLVLINTVRIAESVEHYVGFKHHVGKISAKRTDINGITVLPLDAVHLDDVEYHGIVSERTSKLNELKTKYGTHKGVAKALKDDRTDAEVELQDEIDEKAKKFRDELDDNVRGDIREAFGLTSLPDSHLQELIEFDNDLNGFEGLINANEEEIPKKITQILANHGGRGLPASYDGIGAFGYIRSSNLSEDEASTFKKNMFDVVGPLTTGDDLEEGGFEEGHANDWARLPLSQLSFLVAVAEKKGAEVVNTPVFYDGGVSRGRSSQAITKFPDELVKCLFLMVRLNKKNIPLIVKQLNRFVTGNRPVVCQSVIEFCRQIGNELVVAHDIGYIPTAMMDTENSRILEIKLVWSEFHSNKEDLIQRLPLDKQEEHYMYARLERSPIGKLQSFKDFKEVKLQGLN